MEKISSLSREGFEINFIYMKDGLETITDRVENRLRCDYFTLTIYFRLFIPDMFPEYDKGIYIDSDVVVPGDISKLYNHELGKNLVGACINSQDKLSYKIKTKTARIIISIATRIINKETKIVGIENIKDIKTGAIITSNHFNPLDNLIVQKLIRKLGKKRLYIVSQVSNFAMNGVIGFLMNYSDTIPLSKRVSFMKKQFAKMIKSKLKNNDYILIYPEEEMWFNYRKPRPLKQGAYYYAAKNNVPIISCFTEIIDEDEKYNHEFCTVKHILHVLPPIYPNPNKTAKENSIEMMEKDYNQKKQAYESSYNKKLDYTFNKEDIAG